tara:strand:- start:45482 stop:45721 length:240 start_codon:yes stop_codon:yes gene_type:complete
MRRARGFGWLCGEGAHGTGSDILRFVLCAAGVLGREEFRGLYRGIVGFGFEIYAFAASPVAAADDDFGDFATSTTWCLG